MKKMQRSRSIVVTTAEIPPRTLVDKTMFNHTSLTKRILLSNYMMVSQLQDSNHKSLPPPNKYSLACRAVKNKTSN